MSDLEISKPDFGVKNGEREDVVDERFSSPGLWRHAKYLCCVPTSNNEKLRDHEGQNSATLTCVNSSFVSRPHSVSANAASKLKIPRLPLRQFPVIFSSSIVCTFCTCNLMLGPFGVLAAQRYRSSCRRASKYSVLLHECKSASSGSKLRWFFESSFESEPHPLCTFYC